MNIEHCTIYTENAEYVCLMTTVHSSPRHHAVGHGRTEPGKEIVELNSKWIQFLGRNINTSSLQNDITVLNCFKNPFVDDNFLYASISQAHI